MNVEELGRRLNELSEKVHSLHVSHTELDGDVMALKEGHAEVKAMLAENRLERRAQHEQVMGALADTDSRVSELRAEEHRRQGMARMVGWIVTCLSLFGAGIYAMIKGGQS